MSDNIATMSQKQVDRRRWEMRQLFDMGLAAKQNSKKRAKLLKEICK